MIKMETKKCPKCEETKTVDNYYKCKKAFDGLRYSCKACEKKIKRDYYLKYPERFKKAYTEFKERNPNYVKEYNERRKNNI